MIPISNHSVLICSIWAYILRYTTNNALIMRIRKTAYDFLKVINQRLKITSVAERFALVFRRGCWRTILYGHHVSAHLMNRDTGCPVFWTIFSDVKWTAMEDCNSICLYSKGEFASQPWETGLVSPLGAISRQVHCPEERPPDPWKQASSLEPHLWVQVLPGPLHAALWELELGEPA